MGCMSRLDCYLGFVFLPDFGHCSEFSENLREEKRNESAGDGFLDAAPVFEDDVLFDMWFVVVVNGSEFDVIDG